MKHWLPLLQSLVWPLFFGTLIFSFRAYFKNILDSIVHRINEGSEFGIGPEGLTVKAAPRLPNDPRPNEIIDDGETAPVSDRLLNRERTIEKKEAEDPLETLQLVHRAAFARVKNGRDYYNIIISLDAGLPEAVARVDKVIYFLHKTFRNPVREVRDPEQNFALRTAAWGEFTIRADVYIKDIEEPIRLVRYLNIDTR